MTRNVFEEIMESVELMNDPKFMEGYRRARKDIVERRFEDWEELKSMCLIACLQDPPNQRVREGF